METVTHALTDRNLTSENQLSRGIGTKGSFVVGTGSFDRNGLQQCHVYMAQGWKKKINFFPSLAGVDSIMAMPFPTLKRPNGVIEHEVPCWDDTCRSLW